MVMLKRFQVGPTEVKKEFRIYLIISFVNFVTAVIKLFTAFGKPFP